jgi:hypothetical protein
LARRFSSSVHDTDTNFVLYPGNPPHELRVDFNKDGGLSGIFALPVLSPEKLDEIRQDIYTEFIETADFGVGRQVFFSFYPVRGWWRYRDRLQILPVPPQAPTAPMLYAKHPFLIEYAYRKTNSGLVDTPRRIREASKLQMLLNVLLIPHLTWISPRSVGTSSHHWTLVSNAPGEDWKVEYRQEFYTYKDSSPFDLFSSVDAWPKMAEVAPEEYYRERHIPTGDALDLPSDLALTLDQFFGFEAGLQDRFLHACYWLNQSNTTTSFSLILLSAVQAIEALIPKPKGGKHCPNCGLTVGIGPTKLFNAFLEVFLPASLKAGGGWRSLYRARSSLTHGSSPPLLVDIGPLFSAINPRDVEQRETVGEALRVARICLRNWLNCEPFIHDHVAEAAYFLWEKDGYRYGHDKEHWWQAIADLRNLNFLADSP